MPTRCEQTGIYKSEVVFGENKSFIQVFDRLEQALAESPDVTLPNSRVYNAVYKVRARNEIEMV